MLKRLIPYKVTDTVTAGYTRFWWQTMALLGEEGPGHNSLTQTLNI